MNAFQILSAGLAALTKQEIKRDIRDIERIVEDESDSDTSIKVK